MLIETRHIRDKVLEVMHYFVFISSNEGYSSRQIMWEIFYYSMTGNGKGRSYCPYLICIFIVLSV